MSINKKVKNFKFEINGEDSQLL